MESAKAILKWRQCQTSLSAEKPRLLNFHCFFRNDGLGTLSDEYMVAMTS